MRSSALPAPPGAQLHWASTRQDARARPQVEEVYEQHFDFVWRTARRLGTPASQIDDVVQEVFVVVQRRLAEFEGRSELKTWLFAITRRVVRAHLRQHARNRSASDEELDDLADVQTPDAESQMVADEDTRLLYALLDELDEEKREVFVLSELEEMSGPAIAEALDLHLSNVYARVRVARQAFDAALRRHRARGARAR
ncbi:MAG TPA: sigma-70 family RNA polymerase sigma factor [Polyangiales bacterium]|nr:sigma-70 family RNA polymerase sigma factor [Polyangiales bacterium]